MNRSLDEQYQALHGAVVWTDRSTRDARIDVHGPDAATWLQGLLTQDVVRLQPGDVADAAYLTPQGRMVAELRLVRRQDGFLIETPASARDALLGRLDQFIIMEDVSLADASGRLGCLTLLGPGATDLAQSLTGDSPRDDDHLHLANDGFGVTGIDLIAPADRIAAWRQSLVSSTPEAGDVLLEIARIEAGRPRFGVDMHEDTIPLEAGLESRAISFDKGCYVGQEIVIRILHRGQGRVARRLVWVEGAPTSQADASPWPAGTPVIHGEKSVGAVTSACWSPARGAVLGIAMLHRDATEAGTAVTIAGDAATVSRLP